MLFNQSVNVISDLERKYEYTHWVPGRKIGICYENYESNLNDEKIQLLAAQDGVTSLYITDIANDGCWGQYPEFGIKVQKVQGYYALLNIGEMTPYEDAVLKIVRYEKSDMGLWNQIDVCEEKLSQYYFDVQNKLCLRDESVYLCALDKSDKYKEEQKEKRRKAEEEREARKREQEAREAELLEAQRREAKEAEEKEREREARRKEQVAREAELLEAQKREIKARLDCIGACEVTKEDARKNGIMFFDGEFTEKVFVTKKQDFDQGLCIVIDEFNKRLIKCEKCGEVKREWDFYSYGGKSRTKGICLECHSKKDKF